MILNIIFEVGAFIVFSIASIVLMLWVSNLLYKFQRRFGYFTNSTRGIKLIWIDVKTNALSKQNVSINMIWRFIVEAHPGKPRLVAYLQKTKIAQIEEFAKDIISEQLRLDIATMTTEEISFNPDKFMDTISKNINLELGEIGLKTKYIYLIDIKDELNSINIKTTPTIPQLFAKLLKKMKLK